MKCLILLHAADVSLCASQLLYVGHMAIYSVDWVSSSRCHSQGEL